MEISVNISTLSRAYGEVEALKELNLQINKGELFGLIGPDGAGKTTLFRILVTLLIPDKGTAVVEGYDVVKDFKQLRKIIGYMPGRFSLYEDLSVQENLNFFASIFNTTVQENYYLIEDIYKMLEPFKTRRAGKLSGGMKQKLALSCALIHRPDVLILDEPTTGVDAVSRKEFWEMLKKLKRSGITILVSTPYMDEASLCDRVGLIQDGRLLQTDKPENIVRQYKWPLVKVRSTDMYALKEHLMDFPETRSVFRFGENLHLTLKCPQEDLENLVQYLESKGHKKIITEFTEPTIEDCFMAISTVES